MKLAHRHIAYLALPKRISQSWSEGRWLGCVDRALGLHALVREIVFWGPDLSVFTPAGTPALIVAQVNDTLNKMLRVPDVIKID